MNKRVIVVLGMHRSGTSALIKGLETLGVSLGQELIPADENNLKGYFEDKDIVAINDDLLSALGIDWQAINHISREQQLGLLETPLFTRAEKLLTEKLRDNLILGIKDPRMPRLLFFWKSLFEKLSLETSYIVAYRNPSNVVESLRNRDNLTPIKGYYLWLQHMLPTILDTQDAPRLVVDYDLLVKQPQKELIRVAEAFKLSQKLNQVALEEYASKFVDPSLRHCKDNENTSVPNELSEQLEKISSMFEKMARDELSSDSLEVYEQFKSSWLNMAADRKLLDELNEQTSNYKQLTRNLEKQVSDYKHINRQLEQQITEARQLVSEREQQVAKYRQSIGVQEQKISEYKQIVSGRDQQIVDYKHLQKVYRQELKEAKRLLSETELKLSNELQQVMESNSWRLTKPLRSFRQIFISSPYSFFRKFTSDLTRKIWQLLPLNFDNKQKIKSKVFTYAAPFLKWSVAYQNWQKSQAHHFEIIASEPASSEDFVTTYSGAVDKYVPLLKADPPKEKAARVICLYLPQFHQIPENDEWWGEGFTEWTNVKPAQPQFKGHYQPRVPGELGYYNLLDTKTQQRQVELAKLYGIEGFCFYFYWFAGKTLLEQPIRNYLENKDLDLPFCLCWANENWSRRWDGLENEILIAQNYSMTDDLEFIEHVAEYMRDDRYIRIDGKPLLVLYRPNLLPDAKKTAQIWRNWCKENGLGEIYLAYTQSFESVDPAVYGFDAAIEFPPNNMAPPLVTGQVPERSESYKGQIYDWRVFPERSESYDEPGYKLFRGVNPSWDNTARRKSNSTILYGSSPMGYQEWLFNAIQDARKRFTNPDERIVFVNAWNEWAEGAHLEPDQRYGYAYLEATRLAQLRLKAPAAFGTDSLAIVVHAFYEDIFADIIKRVKEIRNVPFKLFVTTPHSQTRRLDVILQSSGFAYHLLPVNNHGRDVLPFLKIIEYVENEGYDYLLKLHTKKSQHREDGEIWRNDVFGKLLNEKTMKLAINSFDKDPNLGVIGPTGHIVSMDYYWGSNARTVEKLANRLGQSSEQIKSLNFVAGTMFYARMDALRPLKNLAIDDSDFEPEAGQVDGTMAHAIERVISISSAAKNYGLIDTSMNQVQYTTKDYGFAS